MGHQFARIGGATALWLGVGAPLAFAQSASPPAAAAPAPAPAGAAPASAYAPPAPAEDQELVLPLTPLDQFTLLPPHEQQPAPKPPPSVRYDIDIRGLDEIGLTKAFRQLSVLENGHGKAASELQIRARAQDDEELVERLLRAQGYYEGRVTITTEARSASQFRALVAVVPGPQFRFNSITVKGPPTEPPGLARKALRLAPGDPIVATAVTAAEANISLRLPEQGYPFVKVGDRDIALDPHDARGDYTLPVDPGPKASFGVIEPRENVFDLRHLQVIARFKPGEPYDSRMVDDFRRALLATGLFASVGVAPVDTGRQAADGKQVADVDVDGRAGPAHTISGSVGYETGVGATFEAAWSALNLFPPEGALTLHAIAGSQQQLLGVQFTRSNFGQRDRTLFAQVQSSRQDTDAYKAYTGVVQAQISRASTPIWQKRWTYTVGVEGEVSDEEAWDFAIGARAFHTYKIAGLRLAGGYDRSNSLLNPTQGFQILATVNPEAELGRGTHGFVQSTLEGRVYLPVTRSLVLAGRLRVGALFGITAQELAPSRRFYEGGGSNVRGFAYQDLGPKAPDGSPIGGASSNDFSFETRYRFGNMGLVGFVDGGQVYQSHTPRFSDFRYGVGVGGRYYTNFGPIRLDVATPLSRRSGEGVIGVYISIGQNF
jgi:translocation and assembly module TamA